jgi:hypothetical protein
MKMENTNKWINEHETRNCAKNYGRRVNKSSKLNLILEWDIKI